MASRRFEALSASLVLTVSIAILAALFIGKTVFHPVFLLFLLGVLALIYKTVLEVGEMLEGVV